MIKTQLKKLTLLSRLPKFRDLKFSHRIGIVLVLLTLAGGAIGLSFLSLQKVNTEAEQLEAQMINLVDAIGQIKSGVLEIRRQEKNFLLRKELQYRDIHNTLTNSLDSRIDALETSIGELAALHSESKSGNAKDNTVLNNKQIVQSLRKSLADYRLFFDAMAENLLSFGLRIDMGLQGDLAFELDGMESVFLRTEDPNLPITVMRIRELQSQYLSSPDTTTMGLIESEISFLYTLTNEANISSQARKKLVGTIESYQAKWPTIINTVSRIESTQKTFTEAVNKIDPLLEETYQLVQRVLNGKRAGLKDQRQRAIIQVLITLTIIWIVLSTAFWVFSRNMVQRLSSSLQAASNIASGNLSSRIDHTDWGDELGNLSSEMLKMQNSLNSIINKTRITANEVSVAANQVLSGNTELSSRTQEQASSLEEVAASMEEMTGTVDANAENAIHAAELAKETKTLAIDTNNIASQMAAAMNRIEQSNNNIGEILELIQDFAFQTNLLALNAAVEAARAGEHGRGFAVVANEVRNLAGRSAKAAKDIKTAIEDSVTSIREGSVMVGSSVERLEKIANAASEVSDLIGEIANASQEQSSGIQQVNRAVGEMDNITQLNASLVEETTASSEFMGTRAQQLEELVSFFNLNENGVSQNNIVKKAPS